MFHLSMTRNADRQIWCMASTKQHCKGQHPRGNQWLQGSHPTHPTLLMTGSPLSLLRSSLIFVWRAYPTRDQPLANSQSTRKPQRERVKLSMS